MRAILATGCAAFLALIRAPYDELHPTGLFLPPTVQSVRWLAGCLEARTPEKVVEEVRLPPRASAMLGMGRTTTAKRGMIAYELTVIREQGDGLVFEAYPSGQAPEVFRATVTSSDSVVFAAPEHDYPQIVGYRRIGADSVLAWIDGEMHGKRERIEFPYRRVGCPDGRRE
jgi:Domain of unknown function (DUF6265)